MLGLAEGVEPFLAELAPHAALAHAAERRGVVVGERVVDPEGAGLDLVPSPSCAQVRLLVKMFGAEAVLGAGGEGDRLVAVLDHLDRGDGSEDLLAVDSVIGFGRSVRTVGAKNQPGPASRRLPP